MVTIFDCINSILFNKHSTDEITSEESQFNLFMVNRWLSMYSVDMATVINETSNKYAQALTTKEDQFKFLFNILPKQRHRHISYIKKKKEAKATKEDPIDLVELIAKKMEISKREVENYVNNC